MLLKRVIPCLDVKDGRVVKGVRFVDLTDEGDPPTLAERHARNGADEIVFLDIGMPGKDGYEVARELRAKPETQQAVLVALTGWVPRTTVPAHATRGSTIT